LSLRRTTYRLRTGFSRWELLILLVLAALVVQFWAPRVQVLIWRHRRAEVGMVIDSLQEHFSVHGSARFGPAPRESLSVEAVPWSGGPAGWTPPTPLARGSYWVEGGKLHGMCDVDGDGVPARYSATFGGAIVRETAADVY